MSNTIQPFSDRPVLIQLPRILDERGNLSFFENEKQLPFVIERVYWIYDVPGGEVRGGHAFRQQHEVIIALSGSFDIVLHDGQHEERFALNRSYVGLYIPNMYWRMLENFSTNSLALVAANTTFDVADYIRDFDKFREEKNG